MLLKQKKVAELDEWLFDADDDTGCCQASSVGVKGMKFTTQILSDFAVSETRIAFTERKWI